LFLIVYMFLTTPESKEFYENLLVIEDQVTNDDSDAEEFAELVEEMGK